MIQVFSLIVFISVFGVACSNTFNTTSYLEILNKGLDNTDYWITVQDPHNTQGDTFTINKLESENLWNLIEVGEIYLVSYEYKSLQDGVKLISIQIPEGGYDGPPTTD